MKKDALRIFSIAVLIVFFMSANCYAGNLLNNPSFEYGDFPPDGWDDWSGSESKNPNDGVAGFATPKNLSHTGYKGFGKILYGSGERWGGISQTIEVTGGRMFRASGWVMNRRTDVAIGRGAKAFIEVKFTDETEIEMKKIRSSSITRPTKWIKLSARGLVPQKAKKAIFSFVVIGPKGSRGKVLFDDAVLEISD